VYIGGVIRRGGSRSRRRGTTGALLGLAILAASCFLPSFAAAEAPFEPNDALPSAAGPLLAGQTYAAALETPSDRDFFYFYVTAPGAPQVALTVKNLGGESRTADVDVKILDSAATPLAGQAFIAKGEERLLTASLAPQKYFVEVASSEGLSDAYTLSASDGKGAFGSYAQIAGRCARARAAIEVARAALEKAKAKLQRATARLRRSRYGTPSARRSARVAHRHAKHRVAAARRTLREAVESQEPWCSIGQ